MNSKQKQTLLAIFEEPVRSDIHWNEIVSLFISLGAEVNEGKGSRVRIALNNRKAVFHRPHPERQTDKGAIKSVRRFLLESGVEIRHDQT